MGDPYHESKGPNTTERQLSAPSCVQCGIRISEAQSTKLTEGSCPNCGCDFRTREPMSYARMEGFLELETVPDSHVAPEADHDVWANALETRVTERWILTIFLVLVTTLLVLEISLS